MTNQSIRVWCQCASGSRVPESGSGSASKTDFDEIFCSGGAWPKHQPIRFWWRSTTEIWETKFRDRNGILKRIRKFTAAAANNRHFYCIMQMHFMLKMSHTRLDRWPPQFFLGFCRRLALVSGLAAGRVQTRAGKNLGFLRKFFRFLGF